MERQAVNAKHIDRLGERLRAGSAERDDLRPLDEYRRGFLGAHARIAGTLTQFDYPVASRTSKSTASILEKLRREGRMRLSQMQDIAGCRVIVRTLQQQDLLCDALMQRLRVERLADRR